MRSSAGISSASSAPSQRRAADSFQKYAQAAKFRDFRRMLTELDKQIDAQRSTDLFLAVLEARLLSHGRNDALAWARAALRRAPSLAGLDRLLELELAEPQAAAGRDELELTRALLRPQTQRQSRYVCTHCGFRARQYSWQCPGCSRWESCASQRAEELERV